MMPRSVLAIAMMAGFAFVSTTRAVATESDSTYVVTAASRPAERAAAWQDKSDGTLRSAVGESARKAPRKAVRYSVRSVAWPTASVRVLTFEKRRGGVLHPLKDETLLYVLSGTVKTTVGANSVVLGAGDVASLPSGSLSNADKPADAVVVTWTAASLTPGATPAVVRAADTPASKNGQLSIRRYTFPGNSVRAVGMDKGLKTSPNSAKTDSLIYVTGGPMKFLQNGQEFVVNSGDFIREIAGLMHNWDVTENSSFVTTSALPIGAGPIDPSKATDRPPQ